MYNPKKSLKFKLLAFWKKKAPLLTKNAPFENVPKKLGRALPPHLDKIQKNAFFSRETVPESLTPVVETRMM